MKGESRWHEAQLSESDFWTGVAASGAEIGRILERNRQRASAIEQMAGVGFRSALEIGVGPLGLGVIAFLDSIPRRAGLEPLPPVRLQCAEELHRRVATLRQRVHYVVACGEAVPFAAAEFDLVLCCNVLDHVADPDLVLTEARRVLKPGGRLILEVDTFSLLGLAKWTVYTRPLHRNELLVKGHPHRFLEGSLRARLEKRGFRVEKSAGHSPLSRLLGRSRPSWFVATRQP